MFHITSDRKCSCDCSNFSVTFGNVVVSPVFKKVAMIARKGIIYLSQNILQI